MDWPTRHLAAAALLGLGFAASSLPARAQPGEPAEETDIAEPGEPWRAEANRLTGACLALRAEQRELRDRVRASVLELNTWFMTLNEAAGVLADPEPDPAAAAAKRERVAELDRERRRIERWLWGEEAPDEPGLTRTALHARLAEVGRERRGAARLAEAHALEGAFEREHERIAVAEQARQVRAEIEAATLPLRDRLAALDGRAAEAGEPFEEVMTVFGRVSPRGPVAVEAVRADGWFQHGLVSFRWSDRRGRLVATAQVRLRPSVDRDLPPPRLLGRFAILSQTEREVDLSVGYFSVAFRVTVDELGGEQNVLDAVTRLLDLEGLGDVRPARGTSAQN